MLGPMMRFSARHLLGCRQSQEESNALANEPFPIWCYSDVMYHKAHAKNGLRDMSLAPCPLGSNKN